MSGESEPIPERLVELLRVAIESEARLAVLLHLRRHMPKGFTAAAVGAALYTSPASAERDLALLCGRGFLAVTLGVDLLYTYRPVKPNLDAEVAELERLWSERPAEVTRILRRLDTDPATAFADAFRLRKDPGGRRGRRGNDG